MIKRVHLSPHLYFFVFFHFLLFFLLLRTYNQKLSLLKTFLPEDRINTILVSIFVCLSLNNHIWCYIKSNKNIILFCSLMRCSIKLKSEEKQNYKWNCLIISKSAKMVEPDTELGTF